MSVERLKKIRRRFSYFLFFTAAFTILIHLLQILQFHQAFQIEEFTSNSEFSALLIASLIGFGFRAFLLEIKQIMLVASQIILVSSASENAKASKTGVTPVASKTKDHKNTFDYVNSRFPWFIEFGFLTAIILIAIFWANPSLLKNLSSFKAGSVEAHFVAATGTTTVQSGQLVSVDLSRKTTTKTWKDFAYPQKGIDADYPRYKTYLAAQSSPQAMQSAKLFFDNALAPLFEYLSFLDENHLSTTTEINDKIRRAIFDISGKVESRNVADIENIESLGEAYEEICKKSNIVGLKNKMCKASRSYLKMEIAARKDPYIIQAVGDLLFITSTRKQQEDFLIAATRDSEHGDVLCPTECQTAGQLSLSYAVVASKVRSERPWPFQDMIDDLAKTLSGIDKILAHNSNEWRKDETKDQYEAIDKFFHKNRLIDLNIGLELFYQRSLQGQHFTEEQISIWQSWLAEVTAIVDIFDASFKSTQFFDPETYLAWRRASRDIISRTDILRDTYVGAALSLALINQDKDTHAHDCQSAKLYLLKIKKTTPTYSTDANLSEAEKGTYRGFIEQIKSNVENRCSR